MNAMHRTRARLAKAVCLAVLAAATMTSCAAVSNLASPDNVVLGLASAQPAFARNEAVRIKVILENQGAAATGLSEMLDGTLAVTSFTRDGVDVARRRSPIEYEDDLATVLERSLRSVGPGGRAVMNWKSANDRTLGGQAVRTVAFSGAAEHMATYYSVGAPGTYEIVASYAYPGPAGAFGRVFRGPTREARVKFVITP